MITIQSGMLIALGFLAAILLGLLVAPSFWTRAVRLTTRRIKDTMPLSEKEIEADRDRIRAEYAIKMHKLESLVEQVKLAGARQQIEINRRDARVNSLEADLEKLRASYEEAQNARRVLEQTIADRLPRVETRLTEAKKVLHAREREVGELTRTAERQVRALSEASALNAHQQGEIERLSTSLAQRAGRGEGDARSGSEAALKAEIETLRAKAREQAQLLARLQSFSGRTAASAPSQELADERPGAIQPLDAAAVRSSEVAASAEIEQQMRQLRARNDDQAAELARLKAAIAVFERDADGDGKSTIRETRVALKARVQSIEAQSAQQSETVAKLRGELAAANERMARQAAHFQGELKRLGSGTTGEHGRQRRPVAAVRTSLADRVAQARGSGAGGATGAAVIPISDAEASSREEAELATSRAAAEKLPAERGEPSGGGSPTMSPSTDEPADTDAADVAVLKREAPAQPPAPRPRLLDRIAGLSRSS